MKVLLVFGTRPEAIKMAPVFMELSRHRDEIETRVCVTAQHRTMLDQVLSIFGIIPDYDLDIMRDDQDMTDVTTGVMLKLREVLSEFAPDLVLVQGDTTTAMAASLAAYYSRIPVGHIEAGLRTYDKYAPFPEEVNRHIVGVIADYHFAPTEWAKGNLLRENTDADRIFVTGNTVVDALFYISRKIGSSGLQKRFEEEFDFLDGKKRLVLITGHRRENFGDGFKNICLAIKELASKYAGCDFLYPVHLNPNVRRPVKEMLGESDTGNIHLIEPVEYLSFVYLMNRAHLILTDSGGIQEEAPSLGKPVLVMRDVTERPEGVEAGMTRLVGTDKERIVAETARLLNDHGLYDRMSSIRNIYGDGRGAERIVDAILASGERPRMAMDTPPVVFHREKSHAGKG